MNNELIKRILSSIILIPIALFFIVKGTYYFNFFILICFVITAYEWHMMRKKKSYHIFGFIFLIFSFYTVLYQRNYDGDDNKIFLLIIITCIATDIGGYIFGKIFKGPKLTKISPNKTYAGMFGGLILAIISINQFLNNLNFLGLGNNEEMSSQLFIIVLVISLVSQVGDIIVSFFKRSSKIKNTGKIIPGHGGMLDRIDGMIFAFPFVFIILKIL
jgi:phosphatidate cytidylyltransferase